MTSWPRRSSSRSARLTPIPERSASRPWSTATSCPSDRSSPSATVARTACRSSSARTIGRARSSAVASTSCRGARSASTTCSPRHPAHSRRAMRAAYPDLPARRSATDFGGDYGFWYPSTRVADTCSRHAPVWSYRFDFAPRLLKLVGLDATHGVEMFALFDRTDEPVARVFTSLGGDEQYAAAGERMRQHWLHFAETGAPTPPWPRYDERREIDPRHRRLGSRRVGPAQRTTSGLGRVRAVARRMTRHPLYGSTEVRSTRCGSAEVRSRSADSSTTAARSAPARSSATERAAIWSRRRCRICVGLRDAAEPVERAHDPVHRRDAVAAVAERGDDARLPDGRETVAAGAQRRDALGETSPSCSQKRSVDVRTPRAAASSVIVIASSARSGSGGSPRPGSHAAPPARAGPRRVRRRDGRGRP